MNEDRWKSIKLKIKESFEVDDEYVDDLDPGTAECIEFEMPQGIFRASYIVRPKVIGKKTLYSNRPGAGMNVEYEYSDKETVSRLEVEKWDEAHESWQPIKESLF